jgi:hypothetical protein
MTARSIHKVPLTAREALLFEAGVKLGGVFHQYVGTPVSSRTAAGLARTIEAAVGLQPFVVGVRVTIHPKRGTPVGKGRFAYGYLVPQMLDVRVRLSDGQVEVEAHLAHRADLHYPLMNVVRVRAVGRNAHRRAAATR